MQMLAGGAGGRGFMAARIVRASNEKENQGRKFKEVLRKPTLATTAGGGPKQRELSLVETCSRLSKSKRVAGKVLEMETSIPALVFW
jgi:hypothetical protein